MEESDANWSPASQPSQPRHQTSEGSSHPGCPQPSRCHGARMSCTLCPVPAHIINWWLFHPTKCWGSLMLQ